MCFLTTPRLQFHTWSADNIAHAIDLWTDPVVTQFIGGPFSEKYVQQRLEQERENMQQFRLQYWPVFITGTGEFIGCCGMKPFIMENNIPEMGFHFKQQYWGKGYGYEAARAVIEYAFTERDFNSIFAGHHPENSASAQLLLKLGFQFVKHMHYAPTGLQHLSYMLHK